MDDKRRAPRLGANLEIFYFLEQEGEQESSRVYHRGTIINTSEHGIGLLASYPHRPSERLWFEALEGGASPVPGCIRWVENRQDRYCVGVELLGARS